MLGLIYLQILFEIRSPHALSIQNMYNICYDPNSNTADPNSDPDSETLTLKKPLTLKLR